MNDQDLLEAAAQARLQAYAPYSKFQVGAALLCDDGTVVTGCNVENASYGLSCCAERNAIFTAVASGKRNFKRLALVLTGPGSPCGACRQVLNEFAPKLPIIAADPSMQNQRNYSLAELLPNAFGPESL